MELLQITNANTLRHRNDILKSNLTCNSIDHQNQQRNEAGKGDND